MPQFDYEIGEVKERDPNETKDLSHSLAEITSAL
jgi:hypothetical protein